MAPMPPFPPPPLPPAAAAANHSLRSDSSPLLPILAILAFIIMVVVIYGFFFVIKCPTALFDRIRRSSGVFAGNSTSTQLKTNRNNVDQLVSSVVYEEAADVGKGSGGGGGRECPVCLTAFVDGEVIREVKICRHLFHDSCIEMWLCSHSNCPVCRVSVGAKRSKRPVVVGGGDEDFRQGLPDSASLV